MEALVLVAEVSGAVIDLLKSEGSWWHAAVRAGWSRHKEEFCFESSKTGFPLLHVWFFCSVLYLRLLGIAIALWGFSSNACAPWLYHAIRAGTALLVPQIISSFAHFLLRGEVALLGCRLLSEETRRVVSDTPRRRVGGRTDPLSGSARLGREGAVPPSGCQLDSVSPPELLQALLFPVPAASVATEVPGPRSALRAVTTQ